MHCRIELSSSRSLFLHETRTQSPSSFHSDLASPAPVERVTFPFLKSNQLYALYPLSSHSVPIRGGGGIFSYVRVEFTVSFSESHSLYLVIPPSVQRLK